MSSATSRTDDGMLRRVAERHQLFGWCSLLCFLSAGIFLESLHGFKVPWYLEPAFETRRLMWRLGHAHGTLLSLIHLGFASMTLGLAAASRQMLRLASANLVGASILLPSGFLLGGLSIHDGDPGAGIFLVPIGAVLLFAGVLLTVLIVSRNMLRETHVETPQSGRRSARKPERK